MWCHSKCVSVIPSTASTFVNTKIRTILVTLNSTGDVSNILSHSRRSKPLFPSGLIYHSLRATGTTAMFNASVPEKLIREVTGHRLSALHLYERPSLEQQKVSVLS